MLFKSTRPSVYESDELRDFIKSTQSCLLLHSKSYTLTTMQPLWGAKAIRARTKAKNQSAPSACASKGASPTASILLLQEVLKTWLALSAHFCSEIIPKTWVASGNPPPSPPC